MTSPIRVLRQIVAPNGKHRDRPRRPLLLPDEPITRPGTPVPHAVLDEDTLTLLLNTGEVLANEFDKCPNEQRTTYHALYRNGLRKCWTCGTETLGAAQ